MQFEDGVPLYRIRTEAYSTKFFDNFYKVRDVTESVVVQSDFSSLEFYKDLNEGKYHHKFKVTFDLARLKAAYDDGTEMDIIKGTQNVLSSLFYLRRQKLEVGKQFSILVNDNKKNYELIVNVLERENIEVPAGKFDTIVVEPLLKYEGIFQQKGRMLVYLTDDQEKVPVLLRTKISVGSIDAELLRREKASK